MKEGALKSMSHVYSISAVPDLEQDGPREDPIKYKPFCKLENVLIGSKEERNFYRVGIVSGAKWCVGLPSCGAKFYFKSEKDYILLRDHHAKCEQQQSDIL